MTIQQQISNRFEAILAQEFRRESKRKNKKPVASVIRAAIRRQALELVRAVGTRSEAETIVLGYLLNQITSKADVLIDKLRKTNSLDAKAKAVTIATEAIYNIVD